MHSDQLKAIEHFQCGEYTCVLCKGESIIQSTETGIRPLIQWINGKVQLSGYSSADKIVGKAAAFLYVLLGVKSVWAKVMSHGAMSVFDEYNIEYSYEISTDKIINRTNTGICPMEETVLDIDNPDDAYAALKITIEKLKSRK